MSSSTGWKANVSLPHSFCRELVVTSTPRIAGSALRAAVPTSSRSTASPRGSFASRTGSAWLRPDAGSIDRSVDVRLPDRTAGEDGW